MDIVEGSVEDFQWTGEVQKTHLIVQGEEDLDRLGAIAVFCDCTHLECGVLWEKWANAKFSTVGEPWFQWAGSFHTGVALLKLG